MHTIKILRTLIENHELLVYFLIFVGLIFEGEFILISSGILLHLGALNIYFILPFIFLGLFSKTVFGYYLGVAIYDKWSQTKFFKHIEKRVSKVMPHFQQKPFWSIFISKFIMGINNLVVIFSGYKKINFRKYVEAEALSTIIWAPALISLGYFFSLTAIGVSRDVWRFSFIILLFVVLFIIADKLVSWVYELFEEFHDHQ